MRESSNLRLNGNYSELTEMISKAAKYIEDGYKVTDMNKDKGDRPFDPDMWCISLSK